MDHARVSKEIVDRGGRGCHAYDMTFGGLCFNCGHTYNLAGNFAPRYSDSAPKQD